jgi:hypothetical protein
MNRVAVTGSQGIEMGKLGHRYKKYIKLLVMPNNYN